MLPLISLAASQKQNGENRDEPRCPQSAAITLQMCCVFLFSGLSRNQNGSKKGLIAQMNQPHRWRAQLPPPRVGFSWTTLRRADARGAGHSRGLLGTCVNKRQRVHASAVAFSSSAGVRRSPFIWTHTHTHRPDARILTLAFHQSTCVNW